VTVHFLPVPGEPVFFLDDARPDVVLTVLDGQLNAWNADVGSLWQVGEFSSVYTKAVWDGLTTVALTAAAPASDSEALVVAVDIGTGELRWSRTAPYPSVQLHQATVDPVFLDAATVWVQGPPGGTAYSVADGTELWSEDFHIGRTTPPADGPSRPLYVEHLALSEDGNYYSVDYIARINPVE
jgi:outer membrane protein assembly factor BamB